MDKPSIGRIVWYRSRTGAYTVPAMITATQTTLAPGAVEAGIIPALSSPTHVHLTVFSPGIPVVWWNAMLHAKLHNQELGDRDPSPELPPGAESYNLAGTYQEWDTPFFDKPAGTIAVSSAPTPSREEFEQLAGSWTWPERS